MPDDDTPLDQAGQVISAARAAEQAIQQLCRTTLTRPSMTPAEVDIVLARLAEAAAALPQAARQLSDVLAQTKENCVLEMDELTKIEDPDLAIDAARRHLDGVGAAALGLNRLLDAAHNKTVHIAVSDRLANHTKEEARDRSSRARRPENREPPPMRGGGNRSGLRR